MAHVLSTYIPSTGLEGTKSQSSPWILLFVEHIWRWGRAPSWSRRQRSSRQGVSSWSGSWWPRAPGDGSQLALEVTSQGGRCPHTILLGKGSCCCSGTYLPEDLREILPNKLNPRFWIANSISHLFFKQGILMLCRITVWGTLPSISLILCKFTSNSYCQNTVWHSHSTCFFSGEHKAASVQREYVASPWVTHCECWRLWNIFWNWASHKHFIFQKQSHYFCHSAWQMYVCRPWCIHVAHVEQALSAKPVACQQHCRVQRKYFKYALQHSSRFL